MKFSEAFFTAKVEIGKLVLIQTELIQDGRMEIPEVNPVGHGVDSELVRSANHGAAFDAAPCHPPGEPGRAVITSQSIGISAFRQRRPSKLSTPNHQRRI